LFLPITTWQGSNGFFASIAYRADLQAQSVDLSPFIRYDISRIKMKANDVLICLVVHLRLTLPCKYRKLIT
jgi:hypothetical protein